MSGQSELCVQISTKKFNITEPLRVLLVWVWQYDEIQPWRSLIDFLWSHVSVLLFFFLSDSNAEKMDKLRAGQQ